MKNPELGFFFWAGLGAQEPLCLDALPDTTNDPDTIWTHNPLTMSSKRYPLSHNNPNTLVVHFSPISVKSEASDCGKRSKPQSGILAGIGWECLLSKLLYLPMPISNQIPRWIYLELQSYLYI